MSGQDTIAVLGAGGMMGLPMARNLARAGYTVRAWNRTSEKAQPLREEGIDVLDSPGEAAQGAQLLLSMLSDADAVTDAVGQALSSGSRTELWLQMSTIGEEGTERCRELAREHRVTFVDSPVLGTRAPAEQGKLVILASGPEDSHERLDGIFTALGERTLWLGEAGAGTRVKIALNTWVLTVVEGTAEMLALAEGMGVEPSVLLEAVSGGPLDLPYLGMKAKAILDRDFEPSFRLALAAKDAALAERSAHLHKLDLPLVGAIRRRLEEASAKHGDADVAATYLLSAPESAATR